MEAREDAPVLDIAGLVAGYGRGRTVLRDVALDVKRGEQVLVVGHNGAGKTTLLRAVSGLIRPSSGEIQFRGQPLRGLPSMRARLGVAHAASGRSVFGGLSVRDNLLVAADVVKASRGEAAQRQEEALALFGDLADRVGERAGDLSGGQQRMLLLAMVMIMQRARLVLLDEPSLGLAPIMVRRVYDTVREMRKRLGISLLIVEQNIDVSLIGADRIIVLQMGRVVQEVSAQDWDPAATLANHY